MNEIRTAFQIPQMLRNMEIGLKSKYCNQTVASEIKNPQIRSSHKIPGHMRLPANSPSFKPSFRLLEVTLAQ